MGFTCKIFGHKWNGCKCEKCGDIIDEGHNWSIIKGKCIEKCFVCGKERSVEHKWNGCKCEQCGATRDVEHNWSIIKGKCIEKCSVCGKECSVEHKWSGCKCEQCGTTRDVEHKWNNCKCDICSKKRDIGHDYVAIDGKCWEKCTFCGKLSSKHKWNGCKCEICDTVRAAEHDFDLCAGKCIRCGKTQREQHSWSGDKCSRCGKQREEECIMCGKTKADFDKYYEELKKKTPNIVIISRDRLVKCTSCNGIICTICLNKNDGVCPQCKRDM